MAKNDDYEGLPVRKHSVAVRGASGDALNGSLKVEPRDFHPGERAFMVLEVTPADVNHKPMNEGEAWERVQVVRVARGTFVDPSIALPHLDAMTVALEDLRVEQTGQERLELETKLADDHRAGLHKRPRKECPDCLAADPLGEHGETALDGSAPVTQHLAGLHKRRRKGCPLCYPTGHGDGEGDADNPLPPARRRRIKAPGAKKAPAKKRARKSVK